MLDFQNDYQFEKQKLEKEKLEWSKIQKEQELRLKQESSILINLQESILNSKIPKLRNDLNNSTNISELESLKLLYENKLKDLSHQRKILDEEQILFNKYKNDSNDLLKKQLQDLNNKSGQQELKKREISSKMAELEEKEQKLMKKITNFEKNRKDLTELYNEVNKKENENRQRAMDIDDMVKDLDKRKNEINNNKIILENKFEEIQKEKEKIEKEKILLINEKKNLLLKLESIDKVGMNFIGGQSVQDKEKNWQTQKEKFFYDTFSGNFINPLEKNLMNSKTGNNFYNPNKGFNDFNKTDNFH